MEPDGAQAANEGTQADVEPPKLSNDDYIWYLNTERDIIAYIFTYIYQCDALAILYLRQFMDSICHDLIAQSYRTTYMLNNAIDCKIRRPNIGLDEIYNYQHVAAYMIYVGRSCNDFRFHIPCVRDLVHFIDTNLKIVSELDAKSEGRRSFDYDRHQSMYNVIHAHQIYMERKRERENKLFEKRCKERANNTSQEKTKSRHEACIMS